MPYITTGVNTEAAMNFQRLSPTAARWLGATALATVLMIAPVTVTIEGPADSVAMAKGGGDNGGGGDRGGGDRGGGDKGDKGDKGGGDRGDGDKGGHADKGDRGDRGKGNDVASRSHDVGVTSSVGSDNGRGRDLNDGRNDRSRDIGRSLGDRSDRGRDVGRSSSDRNDRSRDFSDRRDSGKNTLGNLNAAHASATARANASPNSMVGRISTYETQMHTALAIQDRSARNTAITAAREQLAQSANKPLTERNISRVDDMLGIRGASSRLGAERRDVTRASFDRRDSDRRDFDRRDFDRRDRDFVRDLLDDRREGRHSHRDGLGAGLGRGLGFGNLPVDPARIEARAAALDALGDRRAAEIRAAGDRLAAGIISRAESRAADLRAREATAKDPAKLEARAVDLVAKANVQAAQIVARADARATALNARVDGRVEDIQAIAAYDRAVIAALALPDRTQQATAIAAARTDLRTSFDRPLSGRTIDRLDDRLGLDGTPTAIATIGSKVNGIDG